MKELLDRFSVERLEEIIGRAEFWGHGAGYTPCEVIVLARIALAVKQAEPIKVEILDKDVDSVKAAFAKGMDRYSGAMLTLAGPEKVIDLYQCSGCGAYWPDKISMCDCMEEGCKTFKHYRAALTPAQEGGQ